MADKSPYVLVSVFKEDAKEQDVAQAESFFGKYNDACKSFLSSYMYEWDAMPLLSLLGNKQTFQ